MSTDHLLTNGPGSGPDDAGHRAAGNTVPTPTASPGHQAARNTAPGPVTAADLVTLVQAVPGVRGIEASIVTTLRALDARLRRQDQDRTRYGLVIDPATGQVTVEISLGAGRPVRQVVADVQRAVQAALAGSSPDAGPDAGADREVLVRVQSLE